MSVELTREQAAVVTDRGGELLVSAAAGSGKTRVLVERLLRRITEEGLDVDQFLVITFTRAAAAELRQKILRELTEQLAEHPNDRHLRRQTGRIYQAKISTIDAFCSSFLRENGHLLDLDPDFRIAEESEGAVLLEETLDRVLEERYEHMDETNFPQLVDSFSAGRDDSQLRSMVLDIYRRVQSHADPIRWLKEQSARFDVTGIHDISETDWGRELLSEAMGKAEYWRDSMGRAIDLMCGDQVLLDAYSGSFSDTMDSLEQFLHGAAEGWDRAAACCAIAFPRLKSARKVADKQAQIQVKAIRDRCKKSMTKVADFFNGTSEALLTELNQVRQPVEELFRLVIDLEISFQEAKKRRHLMDYNDMEHLTVRALRNPDGSASDLAVSWRKRYAEVMVDEYQDTNAVQNAIFDALTDDGKNLFQVGDLKQSIYRFRLADPTIFLRKYHSFAPAEEAKTGQAHKLVLSRNFRSRKSVLNGVNFVFGQLMSRAFGEIDYTEDQRLNPGRSFPEHPNDRVELDVLDVSTVRQDERQLKEAKSTLEARYVAKRVRQLLDESFPVTEGETLRPVRPEEIAILYRSLGKTLGDLTHALDEENIPWQSAGAEDYFASNEVRTALNFLQTVDNPRQDVPLISVLRSPVYGFTADELAELRSAQKNGDFYSCVCHAAENGDAHCKQFLDDLQLLRTVAPDLSCSELLWQIYDRLGLLGLYSAMCGGVHRQENLLAFYDYARSFEGRGRRGVFDFVTAIRRLTERGGALPTRAGKPGSGVQIMTVHKSKGLEFPVVILAGLAHQFNTADEKAPMLFHPTLGVGPKRLDQTLRIHYPTVARVAVQRRLNREMKSEELRLLYVAMTRAQEKLILVMAPERLEQTLSGLLSFAESHPAPELLGEQGSVGACLLLAVLQRPDAAELREGCPPEEPVLCADSWDIRRVSLEQDEQLPEHSPEEVPEEKQTEEAAVQNLFWRYPAQTAAELPSKVTATQLKGRLLDEEAAEETKERTYLKLEFRRPDFVQRSRGLTPAQVGTATHLVLQLVSLDKAATVDGVRGEIARLVSGGWMTEEAGKAVSPAQVAGFWSSELGCAAAKTDTLRREFKFSILKAAADYFPEAPEGEELLLQGVIDCCFETEEGLTVVDFKTDRIRPGAEPERAEQYRSQIEVYTQAITELTGKKVAHKWLWFLATNMGCKIF